MANKNGEEQLSDRAQFNRDRDQWRAATGQLSWRFGDSVSLRCIRCSARAERPTMMAVPATSTMVAAEPLVLEWERTRYNEL
jgi:hypothetical protein